MSHVLSFHHLALFTSSLFLVLGAIWMLSPSRLLSAWGVNFSVSTGLVGRRVSALYFGISMMFFIARNVERSPSRDALVYGLITTCLILAFLGFYELIRGRAGKGILVAAFIEIIISMFFISTIL